MAVQSVATDFQNRVSALVREAYEAGRRQGAEEMRFAILQATQAPSSVLPQDVTSQASGEPGTSKAQRRAPRGSVRHAVIDVLNALPGSTQREVTTHISIHHPEVSIRSVGGELNRSKGRFYRNQGGRWFLNIRKGDMETGASATEAPVPQPQAKESERHAPSLAA